MPSSRPMLTAILRGLRGRCPACGEGRLFEGLIKQAPVCTHCGEPTGEIPADDGPPWFTVLILGPFLAAITFLVSMTPSVPLWLALPILGIGAIGAVLLMLPRVKGVFIGILWRLQKNNQT
ncbi:DUF983 domain-containing protein [Hyphomonas johnsonii]|nr:DUF983 domain-containing protein [Hyphomonas johnsonii]